MNQTIHNIRSSNKKKFKEILSIFYEIGYELPDNGYEVIKEKGKVIYSQVFFINSIQFVLDVKFYLEGKIWKTPNGKLKHLGRINENDKKNGLWTYWYENEEKERQGIYKNGKKDGLWTYWYENGQKDEEITYKNNQKDGRETVWYENGQKD